MKIDETTLRAFVDGELSPPDRSRVEAVLAHDATLAQQVQAMQASRLPYRAAFDAQTLPPIPEALKTQLAALSAGAGAGHATRRGPSHSAQWPAPPWLPQWARTAFGPGGLAAAGMAITFVAGVLTSTWLQGSLPQAVSGLFAASPADAPWVQAIAGYQAMYVRETVDRATDGADHARGILQNFKSREQAQLAIPDLSAAGLEFKRIQLLGFGDRQLIQMAYLPAQGKPAALCVLRADHPDDAAVSARRLENLSIVTWQKDKLAYVLALDMPLDQAIAIGRKLGAQQYPSLYAG